MLYFVPRRSPVGAIFCFFRSALEQRSLVLNRLFRRRAEPDVLVEQGLEKTRRGVFSEITRLFDRGALDDELYDDLEMLLIQADVGWDVSQKLVGELRSSRRSRSHQGSCRRSRDPPTRR